MRRNERIRADTVRVVSEKGEQLGIMSRDEAISLAHSQGKDLVEVAPQAQPVVCKIVDFGKYRYRREKREKKQKKGGKLKEMRFTTKIDKHDLETKLRRISGFLKDENKVRITVIFRGREIVHMELGRQLLQRLKEATAEIARVDMEPRVRGRSLQMVLVPAARPAAQTAKQGKREDKEVQHAQSAP